MGIEIPFAYHTMCLLTWLRPYLIIQFDTDVFGSNFYKETLTKMKIGSMVTLSLQFITKLSKSLNNTCINWTLK